VVVAYVRLWYNNGNVRKDSPSDSGSKILSTRTTRATNSSEAIPSPDHSLPASNLAPTSTSRSCSGQDEIILHDSAPSASSSTGSPSSVKACGASLNGSEYRSARENATAVDICVAERTLMTICAGSTGSTVLREVAMREGSRSEKATSGCGSIAIEENEESVAPWNWF